MKNKCVIIFFVTGFGTGTGIGYGTGTKTKKKKSEMMLWVEKLMYKI